MSPNRLYRRMSFVIALIAHLSTSVVASDSKIRNANLERRAWSNDLFLVKRQLSGPGFTRDPDDTAVWFAFKTQACETYMINDYYNCYENTGTCIRDSAAQYCAWLQQNSDACHVDPSNSGCAQWDGPLVNCGDDIVSLCYYPCLDSGNAPVQPLCDCAATCLANTEATGAYTPAHSTVTSTTTIGWSQAGYTSTLSASGSGLPNTVLIGTPSSPPPHVTTTVISTLPWSSAGYTSTIYASGPVGTDSVIYGQPSAPPPHITTTMTSTLPPSAQPFTSTIYASGPTGIDTVIVGWPSPVSPHPTTTMTSTIPWNSQATTSTIYGPNPTGPDTVVICVPSAPPPHITTTITSTIFWNSQPTTSTIYGPGPTDMDTVIVCVTGAPPLHLTSTVTSYVPYDTPASTYTIYASGPTGIDTVVYRVPTSGPPHVTTTMTTTLPTGSYTRWTSTLIATGSSTIDTVLVAAPGPYPTGTCGPPSMFDCFNSFSGTCCSSYGYCGSGPEYCGQGCQIGFGTCDGQSSSMPSMQPSNAASSLSLKSIAVLTVTRTHQDACSRSSIIGPY